MADTIDSLFSDFDHPESPGAAVMIVKSGKILFEKGYGLANLEEKIPCGTNTNFRLASLHQAVHGDGYHDSGTRRKALV